MAAARYLWETDDLHRLKTTTMAVTATAAATATCLMESIMAIDIDG